MSTTPPADLKFGMQQRSILRTARKMMQPTPRFPEASWSSSTLWPPMAWAIISGLLASTVLTLLVVPSVCTHVISCKVAEPENAPA